MPKASRAQNSRPTTDDRRPTTDDRRPTTDDRRPVVYDEGEHADQPRQALPSPLGVCCEKHLCVGLGTECMPPGAKLAAQLLVVVNFAIEDQHKAPIVTHHGLVSIGAEIDDRQASLAKCNCLCRITDDLMTAVVRTAVPERCQA